MPMDGGNYDIKGNEDDNARIIFSVSDSYDAEKYEPKLGVDPSKIDLGQKEKGTYTATLKVLNTATRDPLGWAEKLTWTAIDDQSWITLSKTSGSVAGGSSDSITVTVKGDDLSKGTHTGEITINSNAGSKTVDVEIIIKDKSIPEQPVTIT